ncbi:hypothetical protein EHF_0188 [Ehrlichia japonica]|uniref:Uncharacterized protein n=1 Tax=Ehrlichia japonica TaxID=391036 RepID=X5H2K6_9RICK|nr:hypothetical protein EHF_0188 [Ehrlichia japonica]
MTNYSLYIVLDTKNYLDRNTQIDKDIYKTNQFSIIKLPHIYSPKVPIQLTII